MIGMKQARGAGALDVSVAFDEPTGSANAFGEAGTGWTQRHACSAAWVYQRGDEAVQAARLAGRHIYKIRIRSCAAARAITTAYRMRDVRRGLPSGVDGDTLPGNRWDIREVDAITDRAWVYLVVEGAQPS